MNLTEQIVAQACLMAGKLDDRDRELLRLLCQSAASALAARLRNGLTPEDCRADFVASASLFALAAMSQVSGDTALEEIKLGDVTLKRKDGDTASRCLHSQATLIIAPYLQDRFCFQGV